MKIPAKGVINQAFSDCETSETQPSSDIIVQQPEYDINRFPEVFETKTKYWFLYFLFGAIMGCFITWGLAALVGTIIEQF